MCTSPERVDIDAAKTKTMTIAIVTTFKLATISGIIVALLTSEKILPKPPKK